MILDEDVLERLRERYPRYNEAAYVFVLSALHFVLEHWGIRETADVGHLVFALVECGILIKQEEDDLGDFEGVFSFDDAFGDDYPWGVDL